jgi:hypothetical protein
MVFMVNFSLVLVVEVMTYLVQNFLTTNFTNGSLFLCNPCNPWLIFGMILQLRNSCHNFSKMNRAA